MDKLYDIAAIGTLAYDMILRTVDQSLFTRDIELLPHIGNSLDLINDSIDSRKVNEGNNPLECLITGFELTAADHFEIGTLTIAHLNMGCGEFIDSLANFLLPNSTKTCPNRCLGNASR